MLEEGTFQSILPGVSMLFETAEQRDEYFANCDKDPKFVALGAAMRHAGLNLGIWGNEYRLKRDCAQVMRYEIVNFSTGLGPMVYGTPTVEEILKSDKFNQAFDAARRGDDMARLNLLAYIGDGADNDSLKDTAKRELKDKFGDQRLTKDDLALLKDALPDSDKWLDDDVPPEVELCIDVLYETSKPHR